MRKIQTIILLVISSITFAQADLYVSTGSYVYVDGAAFTSGPSVAPIFVTDDVNLNTDGYIYLRNNAQLIQGNDVGNKGTGQLSIYQTGNSNTYMYNYWASPVGLNSGTAGNTNLRPNNNFYYENTAPITSLPYTYTGGYDGTGTAIANYWLYTFIGLPTTTNPYEDWIGLGGGSIPVGGDPNGFLGPGYGFTMKGNPSGAQQYDFRGRANNGTISVTLNPNRETLVGNPYASALDARDFIHDSQNQSNTTGVLKYWEQQAGATSHVLSNYVGGYALYTISAGGVDSFTPAPFFMYLLDGSPAGGPPLGPGSKVAKRYIPVGQGFMIEGNGSASNAVFRNSHRNFYKQSDPDSDFFRETEATTSQLDESEYNEQGLNIVPDDFKRFRINVGFDNNGNESYTRQLLMNFHHTASNGFDYGLEAPIYEQLSSDANWFLDGMPYAIQAFIYDIELRIPLIVNIEYQQLAMFSIYDVQNFDEEQPIYIHDIENGLYVNLQDQAYEISLEPGNYNSRFEIVFQNQSLSTDMIYDEDFTIIQNNDTSQLTILNPNQLELQTVTLFDVSGKIIFNEQGLEMKDRYHFSTKNLSEGVYIAKVAFSDQSSMSKKVVVSQNK